jgi:putative FmdB family regulatory protein
MLDEPSLDDASLALGTAECQVRCFSGRLTVPTYQYACTACGHRLEAVQSFADEPLTSCPECEGRLRKLFSSVGIVFKGSGFYRTDSRSGANGTSSPEKTEKTEKADKADKGSTPEKSSTDKSEKTPAAEKKSDSPKPAIASAA